MLSKFVNICRYRLTVLRRLFSFFYFDSCQLHVGRTHELKKKVHDRKITIFNGNMSNKFIKKNDIITDTFCKYWENAWYDSDFFLIYDIFWFGIGWLCRPSALLHSFRAEFHL